MSNFQNILKKKTSLLLFFWLTQGLAVIKPQISVLHSTEDCRNQWWIPTYVLYKKLPAMTTPLLLLHIPMMFLSQPIHTFPVSMDTLPPQLQVPSMPQFVLQSIQRGSKQPTWVVQTWTHVNWWTSWYQKLDNQWICLGFPWGHWEIKSLHAWWIHTLMVGWRRKSVNCIFFLWCD